MSKKKKKRAKEASHHESHQKSRGISNRSKVQIQALNRRFTSSRKILFVDGAVLGIIFFLILFGPDVINVQNTDWLLIPGKADTSQHYLGWRFFRESNWFFPIGLFDTLSYPRKMSIIFTDSIPLFAVPFKLFSALLPTSFQYFGIWGVFCFIMEGGLSALIMKEFVPNNWLCLIYSIPLIIFPTVILKLFYQCALAGQWLILLAILIWIRKDHFDSLKTFGKTISFHQPYAARFHIQ